MAPPQPEQGSDDWDGGERWEWRSLTVLFCDLVGSTELISRLDDEDYSRTLRRFYAVCTEAIRANSGMVAQYQGDSVVCQFGWPHAEEDDASRAIRAALAVMDGMAVVRLPDGGVLSARAGLASGRIKLQADGGDFGAGAFGASLNKAARLQAIAPAGGVMVCEATRKLAGDAFEYRATEATLLRGFSAAETVFRVLRERARPTSRFDALRRRRSGPLIGRDAELHRLLGALDSARRGEGAAMVLTAPAGYGKSRLLSALCEHPDARDCRTFSLQCASEMRGAALHPLRQFVEWNAGALRRHDPSERHERLTRLFEVVWGLAGEPLRDILDLLSPLGSGTAPNEEETAVPRRRRAFAILRDVLFRRARGAGAVIFIVEDMHWADPSTLEFLHELVAEIAGQPVLVLVTARPDADTLGDAEVLDLAALSAADSAALARQAISASALTPDLLEAVVRRAEGVPLFVEEYAEMLAGSAEQDGPSDQARVPLSLDAIVRSRLDALSPQVQQLARAGSAFGRRFVVGAACRVAALADEDAAGAVEALLGSRLAERAEAGERDTLQFSHGLVRDAIYGSLDGGERRVIHGRIAEQLDADGAANGIGEEVVGEHLSAAGRPAEAIERFLHAAMGATRIGAVAEAHGHLERALAALPRVVDAALHDPLELRIRAIQGPTLMVMRGPGNPAFGAAQDRAIALLQRLDLRAEAVPVIYNAALHAWARGNLAEADRIAGELEDIEQTDPGDGVHMAANTMRGLVAWHQGRNEDARRHLMAVVARYDPARHRDLYAVFLKEFGVFAQFYLALTETVMGNFAAGAAAAERAAAIAHEVRRPHAVGFGMLARFNCALLRGDVATAETAATEALAFAQRQGFPEFAAMAGFTLGWVACRHGRTEEGLASMQAGAASWDATGFASWQPVFAALTAREAVTAGHLDLARTLVEWFSGTAEAQADAPLLLTRALIARADGDAADAVHLAEQAGALAEAQSGRLWLNHIDTAFDPACHDAIGRAHA